MYRASVPAGSEPDFTMMSFYPFGVSDGDRKDRKKKVD